MTQAPWQQGAPPQQYQQAPPQGWQQGAPPQGPPPQQAGPPQGQPWQQTPQAPPAGPPQGQQSQSSEEGDDEFFIGGMGGKYMSFGDDRCIGIPRGGEIIGIDERQQTNNKTKEPEFWPNSDRKIMIKIVTVQTQERIPNDPDDLGVRSIWLPTSRDITKAVIDAMKAAQLSEMRLKLGGYLWITRTGSRQTTQANGSKGNPAFTYTAQYIPPAPGVRNDAFFAGPPANGQAPAQTAPPQQGPPAQGQTPWQQSAPPSQGNPYQTGQQAGLPANNGWQQGSPQGQQGQGQAPPQQQGGWHQQGPPQGQQGGYQPPQIDPQNPWGNQQGAPPQQQGGWQGQQ